MIEFCEARCCEGSEQERERKKRIWKSLFWRYAQILWNLYLPLKKAERTGLSFAGMW